MSDPAWKKDFPIAWAEDDYVTRRELTKSLVWISCACFAGSVGLAARARVEGTSAPLPEMKIAALDDVEVGAARVFHYPDEASPCVLIRLEADRFVAFEQKCTHLGCPVMYEARTQRLACPCHEGYFDATDGEVLAGPPPRALAKIALERRGGELWAVGRHA